MKKKLLPGIMAGAVILLALLIILIASLVNKFSPSKEVMSLDKYFNLTEEGQIPILSNFSLEDTFAVTFDDEIYLDNTFVKENLSSRFYWDNNENILLYATSESLFSAEANATSYYKDKKSVSVDKAIVKPKADGCYISISYLANFIDMEYQIFDSPKRLVITTKFSDVDIASTKKATQVRYEASIKSPILKELEKGEEVTVIEEADDFTKVLTNDGIVGYVLNKKLGSSSTKKNSHETVKEEFYHDLMDKDVCLGWQYVDYRVGSESASDLLKSTKGLNVISPTWFRLCDSDGNVTDLASEDYVKYCHNQNIEVWALVNDFDTEEYYGDIVLTHTSKRQALENQLISKAISYNLDGLNIDFEKIKEDFAPDYLQFIRELAIKCHNNGIRLSVDNYMPSSWNTYLAFNEQALFADYVVLMGYDEHWAGSDPGSVSSIGWVKSGISTILEMVPAKQVVLGMPFYTRIYKYTPNDNMETSDIIDLETCYTLSSSAYTMASLDKVLGSRMEEATWDEAAGQYYLEYTNDAGCICKVWLETTESLEGRMKVMDENDLAGCAFWRLGQEKKEAWDTVIKYLN